LDRMWCCREMRSTPSTFACSSRCAHIAYSSYMAARSSRVAAHSPGQPLLMGRLPAHEPGCPPHQPAGSTDQLHAMLGTAAHGFMLTCAWAAGDFRSSLHKQKPTPATPTTPAAAIICHGLMRCLLFLSSGRHRCCRAEVQSLQ
jgi:hypothetical protein